MRKNDRALFETKFRVTPGCWVWESSRTPTGYGRFRGDFGDTAHRFSYATYVGTIPHGMQVCHKCDNPFCVNPDHLFLGSNQENVNDKVAKGRHPRGEKSATAKLSDKIVKEIRTRYVKGSTDLGTRALARLYHVSHRLIWSIVANKDRV